MKKTRTAAPDDFTIGEIQKAVEKKAGTARQYLFKRTYIGLLGAFYQGKSYELTEDQYNQLKADVS
jgi:hypothetical protein